MRVAGVGLYGGHQLVVVPAAHRRAAGHSTAFAIEQGQGSVHLRLPPETWVDSPSEQTGQVFRELLGGG